MTEYTDQSSRIGVVPDDAYLAMACSADEQAVAIDNLALPGCIQWIIQAAMAFDMS